MLDKLLTGKAVAVRPFIGEIEQGMGGGSTPQDLETMFQLLHLRFTQPRADPVAFAALASQARALLANRDASPDVVFNQTIDAALSRNSPRRQPETPATVDKWNLPKSLAFYKARFADASQLHVRLRRQLHARDDQADRRDLPRQPAGDARERDLARPRHHAADGRGRKDDRDGHRAEEPGGDRVLRAVRVRR